jgi:hypothetical protein
MSATVNALGPFEMRFDPLFSGGHALVFPCDARGQVDLDALPPRARRDYFFARALIGRAFGRPHLSCPTVQSAPASTRSQP